MFKRLGLARNLLSDDGVIFISIDDDEQAQLKLLCDEVFGNENFIAMLLWNKENTQPDAHNVEGNHEYVITYAKKKRSHLVGSFESAKKTKVLKDDNGRFYKEGSFTTGNNGTLAARPNLGATIYYNPETGDIVAERDYDITRAKTAQRIEDIYTDDEELVEKGYIPIRAGYVRNTKIKSWTWSAERFNDEKDRVKVVPYKNGKGYKLVKKTYIPPEQVVLEDGEYYSINAEYAPIKSILTVPGKGGADFSTVLPDRDFEYPKPVSLIKTLVNFYCGKNGNITVMDFFAGSGTTAQAMMELNLEDSKNVRWILVTNNEGGKLVSSDGICRAITKPRTDAVITGVRPDGTKWSKPFGGSYDYYTIEMMERSSRYRNVGKLGVPPAAVSYCCIAAGISESSVEHHRDEGFHSNAGDGRVEALLFIADIGCDFAALTESARSHLEEHGEVARKVLYLGGAYANTEIPRIEELLAMGFSVVDIDSLLTPNKYAESDAKPKQASRAELEMMSAIVGDEDE